MLTYHQMEALRAIHRLGSIQKAALEIGSSQSALSRLLRQVEEALGAQLFQRTGRGVTPTDAGNRAVEFCDETLRRFDSLRNGLDALGGSVRGPVSIGMPPSIARIAIVPFSDRMKHTAPDAVPRIIAGFTGEIVDGISSGKLDLGVIYADSRLNRTLLDRIVLDDLFLVTAAGRRPNAPEEVPFSDILDEDLILPAREGGARGLVDREFARLGRSPNMVMEVDASIALFDLVRDGKAATLSSFSLVHREVEAGLLSASRVVCPALSREIWVVTSAERPATPVVRTTAILLRHLIRDLAPKARWRAI